VIIFKRENIEMKLEIGKDNMCAEIIYIRNYWLSVCTNDCGKNFHEDI
jgi:hypothetical protein